jgi:hypothetical protein
VADHAGNEERDEELGAAIRQLYVPPAGEDFYATLYARLEAEEAAMRPAVQRARRRWLTPAGFSAVAAVVAIVVLMTWVGLPGRDRSGLLGPGRAEAITLEEMQGIVTATLTSVRTLQGEVTIERLGGRAPFTDPEETRFSFALTSQGDHRMTALGGVSDHSYDAEEGLQRIVVPGFGSNAPSVSESRGLSAGPPDPSPDRSLLARSLGFLVRTFLGVRADVPVVETELDGRPVWRAVVPLGRDRTLEVAVDRETGFPLETIMREPAVVGPGDRVLEHVRVSKLVVDEPISRERFRLAFPAGVAAPTPINLGFRRVALGDVERQVGYRPLLPRDVPDGFELVEVATARQSAGTGRNNPISQNVVSMAYQRGFDRIVVSTRSTGADPSRWSDPLASTEDQGEPQPVRVRGGALDGATAVVVLGREGYHLWAVTDQLVVTITGDASQEQLLAMAGSLAPRG